MGQKRVPTQDAGFYRFQVVKFQAQPPAC
jgi:hypothetical protein